MSFSTIRISFITAVATLILVSCGGGNKTQFAMGTFGHDKEFFDSVGVGTVILSSPDGNSKVLIVPAYQGRVMTSTTGGDSGTSYGWINYDFIRKGEISSQFNPLGGEDRFWIGPEGGQFSWFFKKGQEQIYANWRVPSIIDTEPFELVSSDSSKALFTKDFCVKNASDVDFEMKVDRLIRLLSTEDIFSILGTSVPERVKCIGYSTRNTITNKGDEAWTQETGMPSVWLLCTFNPTPTTTVFIPYNKEYDGKPVKDDYFGSVPSDRLVTKEGMVYFKIDGEYRAKIGLPSTASLGLCGSYDRKAGVLNILKYNLPEGNPAYVNGQWGPQDNPFEGDAINSYNDGPTETGFVQGPFFEIETSSPAAALAPGESMTHIQYMFHFEGDHAALSRIASVATGADLSTVSRVFK